MRSRRGTRVWLCRSEGAGRLRGMWTVRVFTEPRSDFKKSKDGERRRWGRLGHGDQGGGFWGGLEGGGRTGEPGPEEVLGGDGGEEVL